MRQQSNWSWGLLIGCGFLAQCLTGCGQPQTTPTPAPTFTPTRPTPRPVQPTLPPQSIPTIVLDVLNQSTRIKLMAYQQALMQYRQDHGEFPNDEQGLDALKTLNPEGRPYMIAVEPDPWGHPFRYRQHSQYGQLVPDIWSVGPDGEDGTADDLGNWPPGATKTDPLAE